MKLGYVGYRMLLKWVVIEMGLLDLERLACGQRYVLGTLDVEMNLPVL